MRCIFGKTKNAQFCKGFLWKGDSAAFPQLTMTGLDDSGPTDAALVGSHGSISVGFPSGVTAWSSQAWGTAYGDDTYGTGANPTDIAAGVDGTMFWQGVGDDGNTYRANAPIWYALGTASAIADGQSWTIDDTSVNLDGSASGTGLTFTYELSGSTSGVTINSSTGAVTGTPFEIAPSSGTATITATDQYSRTYTDTFTWSVSLRTQATGGVDLDLAYTQDSAITPQDLLANWTASGNTLTLVSVTPSLPTGLSVSSAGELSGTPTVSAADDTYTITMEDEYGRETADTFTLQVTASAVNPSTTNLAFVAGGSGSPNQLNPTIVYTGGDVLTGYMVTSTEATCPGADAAARKANVAAGTGTGSLEEATASVSSGVEVDLTSLFTSTSESATYIHYYTAETNNGGEDTDVTTVAVSGLDFTLPTFSSAEVGNVNADTVRVTLSEAMYGSAGTTGNWSLTGNTISAVSFTPGNSYVDLTLGTTATSGDDYTGDLSFDGTGLTDAKGNTLATFTGQNVTNNVSAGGPTIEASGTHIVQDSSSGTTTVTIPGTPLENDIVLAIVGLDAPVSPNLISTPSGFVEIFRSSDTQGWAAYYKRMGSTPDTTYNLPQQTGGNDGYDQAVITLLIRGVDTTTALDVAVPTHTSTGGSTTITPPGVTTANNNSLVVYCAFQDDRKDGVSAYPSETSTYQYTFASDGAVNSCSQVAVAAFVKATAGAVSPGSFTFPSSDAIRAETIAFRAA